jgi:alanyl aminopeptidase
VRVARRAYELADDVPEAMIDPPNAARYSAWIRRYFGDRARAIGWLPRQGETPEALRLREKAVPLVADRGQDAALARKAQQLAQRWLVHRSAIPPESRKIVLVAAARSAGKDAPRLFDALERIARSGKDTNEQEDVYVALGSFRDPVLLTRALSLMLAPRVDGRDLASDMLEQALQDAQTRPIALGWLATNMAAQSATTPREKQGYLVVWTSNACTEGERKQIVALFEARAAELEAGTRKFRETIERIDACLALRRAQQVTFNAFLATVK